MCKMKKAIIFTFLLALSIATMIFISGCSQGASIKDNVSGQLTETAGLTSYENKAYGIKINYPSDWARNEGSMGTVAMFLSPLESSSDTFRENVNIIVQDLSAQPMTLKEYTDLSLAQIGEFVTDSNVISSTATVIDGNPANSIIYTGRQGQYIFKWMQAWAIKDNKAYVLTYTANEDTYNAFLSMVQEMLGSFEII